MQRRKLDAVYYYMRSLMSSNPAPGAKEYLTNLFDENRRKVCITKVFERFANHLTKSAVTNFNSCLFFRAAVPSSNMCTYGIIIYRRIISVQA